MLPFNKRPHCCHNAFSGALCFFSLAVDAAAGTAHAQSAVPEADYYVEKKVLVKPGQEGWCVDYWQTKVPAFAALPGYIGYIISITFSDPELGAEQRNSGPLPPLDPPNEVFTEHGRIELGGTTTNTMVHFDALLRGTCDNKIVQCRRDSVSPRGLLPLLGANSIRHNSDADAWGTLEKEYLSNIENHWGTRYRMMGQTGPKIVSEVGK